MRHASLPVSTALLLALGLSGSPLASAGPPSAPAPLGDPASGAEPLLAPSACTTEAARQHLDELAGRAFEIAADEARSMEAKTADLAALMDSYFDLPFIGSFALGRHLSDMSPEQLAAFDAVFPRYFVDAYAERIGKIVEASFDIGEAVERRPGDFVVESEIERRSTGDIIDVRWRIRCGEEGEMAIIDFAARGVSTVITQRSEFAGVIDDRGIAGLLVELEERAQDAEIN